MANALCLYSSSIDCSGNKNIIGSHVASTYGSHLLLDGLLIVTKGCLNLGSLFGPVEDVISLDSASCFIFSEALREFMVTFFHELRYLSILLDFRFRYWYAGQVIPPDGWVAVHIECGQLDPLNRGVKPGRDSSYIYRFPNIEFHK